MYHILAVSVPEEERSRAFAYLVAAGSVGQTIASVVKLLIISQKFTSAVISNKHNYIWSLDSGNAKSENQLQYFFFATFHFP
jgi:hypothetical protein